MKLLKKYLTVTLSSIVVLIGGYIATNKGGTSHDLGLSSGESDSFITKTYADAAPVPFDPGGSGSCSGGGGSY